MVPLLPDSQMYVFAKGPLYYYPLEYAREVVSFLHVYLLYFCVHFYIPILLLIHAIVSSLSFHN